MKQRGFSLLELVVALGISSAVIFVGVGFIYQAYFTTRDVRSYNSIFTNLDAATSQVRKDLYSAHETNLVDGVPKHSIVMSWTDYAATSANYTAGRPYYVSYSINGTDLMRTFNDSESITVSVVARNVTDIVFTQSIRFISVDVIATSKEARPISREISFSVYRRSVGIN